MQTTNQKLKVAIVDDHYLFPLSLDAVIKKYDFMETIAVLNSGIELVNRLEELQPDIIFMDIVMPGMDGVEATKLVMDKYPKTKVIGITYHDDGENVKNMMEAGAWGYIMKGGQKKEFDELFEHIQANKKFISSQAAINYTLYMTNADENNQNNGKNTKVMVTKRELEIINHIAQGLSDKEIAKKLSVSHRTVDAHKQNIMQKLDTRKSAEIVSIAYRLKLI